MIEENILFIVTVGLHDDFMVHGLFKTLKDLNLDDLLEMHFRVCPEQEGFSRDYQFLAWLIANGFIEAIQCPLMYLGDACEHAKVTDFSYKFLTLTFNEKYGKIE